ncbi:ribonuclease H-like domain-containing protein (plasmid) [Natrinema zhouii]|uniref:ribonuclease H-like domain-containing protein n=1 Tax=Natrinema zhouii TaxID=1710539 RepID=UPI001CFF9CC5|nr:ribonuclease H-like domain-containing protein [Natrinema zhouii]UHQ98244.1 ribonuclease H-like domain-containing protein [Natrinema zhouii]
MQYDRDDAGYDRIVTLDIETTHYKPDQGETVSVGIATHDRGASADDVSYQTFHRSGDDEAAMIARAFQSIDNAGADALVTFHGQDFDLEFLSDRLYRLGAENFLSEVDVLGTHVDLFADRKAVCDRTGDKWPSLEECLVSYGFPEPTTVWNGQPVDNTRFGEELGPLYLEVLESGTDDVCEQLTSVINHYLVTDLEANLALYYADIGAAFEPGRLGTRKEFDVLS